MSSGIEGGIDNAPETADVRATLEAWRAHGADRVNPARFRFIDALARRTARHEGDVRRVLEARLAALIADYSAEIERAEAEAEAEADDTVAATEPQAEGAIKNGGDTRTSAAIRSGGLSTHTAPNRSALAELVDLLTSRAAAAAQREASADRDTQLAHRHDASPDLPVLDYFRETWSRLGTEKQLRQSLEQVPDNAGPLNSHSLMHRALSLMRDLSPGYLKAFLSYAESLAWMEHLAGPGPAASANTVLSPAAPPSRTGSTKKRPRPKAR